jgi:hypothetical protein
MVSIKFITIVLLGALVLIWILNQIFRAFLQMLKVVIFCIVLFGMFYYVKSEIKMPVLESEEKFEFKPTEVHEHLLMGQWVMTNQKGAIIEFNFKGDGSLETTLPDGRALPTANWAVNGHKLCLSFEGHPCYQMKFIHSDSLVLGFGNTEYSMALARLKK